MTTPFDDRRHGGRVLAERLKTIVRPDEDAVVLALPRGGVPVGFEVASRLGAPLDVFVVRKLGVPGHDEYAMGALASGGTILLNHHVIDSLRITEDGVRRVVDRERAELDRRERAYRGDRPPLDTAGKTVVIVDDGLATGSTMRAAVIAAREHEPARVVVAVPTGSPETCAELADVAEDVVCAVEPRPFRAVGEWYRDFTQTTDDEVRALLGAAGGSDRDGPSDTAVEAKEVRVGAAGVELAGNLATPKRPAGIVMFAHGSGSGRHSPRNRAVAARLQQAGLATFLVDLLTADEERVDMRTRALRFDIDLLADRLVALGDALHRHPATGDLRLGLFGASTGGGAALVAAAHRPDLVAAVVSRGGRPDLAGPLLADVRAPTLLLVGGRDDVVLDLNRRALAAMHGEHHLEVVAGATHLFEEPGTLDTVSALARDWFTAHLSTAAMTDGTQRTRR